MQNPKALPDNFFKTACFFEAALAVLAIFLGWLLDVDPFVNIGLSEPALLNSIVLTLPLILIFLALQQLPYPPLQKIRALLLETLGAKLYQRNWADMLILAGIAGFSEELLFRGVLQPWLENISNLTLGLILSNLLFAAVHAVTPLYAVLAFLMGLYLGLSLDYSDTRNLLQPILIHAFYDFVAFMVILNNYRNNLRAAG